MLKAYWQSYRLRFKTPSRTSRSLMNDKLTYFIKIEDVESGHVGYGEVALFQGLSAEDNGDFEYELNRVCNAINSIHLEEIGASSIRFGVETALADLANGGVMQPYGSFGEKWQHEINGLVWMADKTTMLRQAEQKIASGFRCVKLKIGGIDFEQELEILATIRNRFSSNQLELRLDANGAFTPENALRKLEALARFDIHSLEQPIRPGQTEAMAEICRHSPIPIVLDEELIGITSDDNKNELIQSIRPAYIILKPSLCGGFAEADKWIKAAENYGVGWWATSALESDIGLNAIARWLSEKSPLSLPQGLGTGMLYTNNIPSQLYLSGSTLSVDYDKKWDLSALTV